MGQQKVMNRWLVVVGAILIQLCLGAIYAWSVFTPGLSASADKFPDIYSAGYLEVEQAAYDTLKSDYKVKNDALFAKLDAAKDDAGKTAVKGEIAKLKADKKVEWGAWVSEKVPAAKLAKITYGFSKVQTQAVFSAGLAFFAIVMVLAGRMMPKVGPQKLAMAGGVVLGVGYLLAGLLAGTNFYLNFLFIGVIGGSGIGLAYVVPIAVGMRWFPDKKGMITGLAVAGFGFGATLWVKLGGAWGHLIENMGLDLTFMLYGVIFAVAVIGGGFFMVFPPDGWQPEGWEPPKVDAKGGGEAKGMVNFTSGEMLKTPQFYMIFLTFLMGAGAGLMSIGLMKAFPGEALQANGYTATEASAIAGTAMAVFFSLANGIGRIAWGMMSDKLGRKPSIIIMTATQGVLVLAFPWMCGTPALLYLGATLIGFNFGGNFALFPTITADTFGTKNVGQNYGWVFLAYGVGGTIGPIMGGKLGDMGNFPLAFTICGIGCLVAAGIIAAVQPAKGAAPAPAETEKESA